MMLELRRFGLLALVGVMLTVGPTLARADSDANRVAKGFQITPVPLKLSGLDRNQVGLGSYIVNAVAGCGDCHSNPPYAKGGDPYSGQKTKINVKGYLAGGQAFGPFISANITPDAKGLPAGLTFAKFVQAVQNGHDPDVPGRLLQVMPWPVYHNMTFGEVRAIYEYLRAVPSIKGGS